MNDFNFEFFKYEGYLIKKKLLELFNSIRQNQQIKLDQSLIYIKMVKRYDNNPIGITLLSTTSELHKNILKNELNKYSEKSLEEEQCDCRKGING